MSFIDHIKKDNIEYDIQDTKARELIDKLNADKADKKGIPTKTSELTNDSGFISSIPAETDPTVPSYVKAITEADINNWNTKSNFSGKYSDLTDVPNEFNPSSHNHKMSDITDYQEPDLSDYALKSEIPTNYITEIPAEYITETELNQAIENMASGAGIQEITEDTNIFDLETGIYYVNGGVTLTYASFPMGEEGGMNTSVNVVGKSVLTVAKTINEDEGMGQLNYTIMGFTEAFGEGAKIIYGELMGMFDGNGYLWVGAAPMTFDNASITSLSNIREKISADSQDDLSIATSGAIYLFVTTEIKKAIGTALEGSY